MPIGVLSQLNVLNAPVNAEEVIRKREFDFGRRDIPVVTVTAFSYGELQAANLQTFKTYLVKDDAQEYFVYNHPQLGYICFGVNLADADGLSGHAGDTGNPHEVTLSQAASEQSTNNVVIAGRVYLGGVSEDNKYLTASEIAQRYASAVKYKGRLKYGAMTVADMEAIETSADDHDLTAGDVCGVHAAQLSYSWNGSAWNALPQGADELGDMYLIEYWYGTFDGKVYSGEVQAQIICKETSPGVIFDLYLDTTILLDGAVTDNKIGTRTLTDAAGDDVLTPAEGKSLTAWLQGIRNNLKYALNTLLGKQNVITATGSGNVLTAPAVAGDQPGTVAKASLYGQQFAVFPDYNARSSIGTLTIPETGTPDTDWQSNTITVQQSGYIMLDGRAKVSSGFVYRGVIIINGKTVWSSDVDGVMTWVDYAQGPFPVSAGDTAQIRMGLPVASPSWNNRAITCYFVPPKVALMQASPAMANSLTTMGPPDYSRQEATNRITSNNGTWTVDRNGYVRVQIQAMSAASACCEINGRRVGQNYSGVSAGSQAFLADVYPVKTGDVVKLFVDADVATNILCNYIPPVINPPLYVDGDALVNYSTIEQDTGIKWLDGKTIYQRTLTGTKDVSANLNTVLVTVTGVERLIKGEGVVSRGASSFVTIPCRTVDASEAAGHLVGDITQATGGSIAVTIRSDVAITGAYYAVTLQYTKI